MTLSGHPLNATKCPLLGDILNSDMQSCMKRRRSNNAIKSVAELEELGQSKRGFNDKAYP